MGKNYLPRQINDGLVYEKWIEHYLYKEYKIFRWYFSISKKYKWWVTGEMQLHQNPWFEEDEFIFFYIFSYYYGRYVRFLRSIETIVA